LNKPDARRQKSRRHFDRGAAAALSRVNYGIEAWDYKLHEPILDFGFSILDWADGPAPQVLQSKI
jgi:hypothetical protein